MVLLVLGSTLISLYRTICLNNPGSYECACIDGYEKTGKGAVHMSTEMSGTVISVISNKIMFVLI